MTTGPLSTRPPASSTRKEVNQPLQTGILAIDSMFPIGRGQRELIIGDRQTGKTAHGCGHHSEPEGQRTSSASMWPSARRPPRVAQIVNTLQDPWRHGLLPSWSPPLRPIPPPLQYIAPYAGCRHRRVLHGRGQGRAHHLRRSEQARTWLTVPFLCCSSAPQDVRPIPATCSICTPVCWSAPAQLATRSYGGGSMTALPIIETQAGDVSAYIPTNVISITDGQIFLESDLFHSGQRPAVNVGLSVSRVGGDGPDQGHEDRWPVPCVSTCPSTARWRSFTQFSSDLDEATQQYAGLWPQPVTSC